MTQREVMRLVLEGRTPPYVPWDFSFTHEARAKLVAHYGTADLDPILNNHQLWLGSPCGYFADLGHDRVRDYFGVVWDRSQDKDIGVLDGLVLPEPTLARYTFPDAQGAALFGDIPGQLAAQPGKFRVYPIGFSLYERAWTLRGMENLMMDFYEHPAFVHELLDAIADFNIAVVRNAVRQDIDAVYFGDDWGAQHGLQMGPALWKEFIYPRLRRMYAAVRGAGKFVMIHSCGDVDELFDDLIGIGLNCFNPFQPEVMDVHALHAKYRGRLAFHGGLSTQRTLPYGSVAEVQRETDSLLAMGRNGGYVFAPAHAVEGDVPLANLLAFIERVHGQAR